MGFIMALDKAHFFDCIQDALLMKCFGEKSYLKFYNGSVLISWA